MLRVMVVDDEPGMVKLAKRLLERGKQFLVVASAHNGRDAIEQARHHDVDLILLDNMMPLMSGLDALPQLRSLRPHAKIIFWSMLNDERLLATAIARGAHACLDKSEDPMQLSNRLLDLSSSEPAPAKSIPDPL